MSIIVVPFEISLSLLTLEIGSSVNSYKKLISCRVKFINFSHKFPWHAIIGPDWNYKKLTISVCSLPNVLAQTEKVPWPYKKLVWSENVFASIFRLVNEVTGGGFPFHSLPKIFTLKLASLLQVRLCANPWAAVKAYH